MRRMKYNHRIFSFSFDEREIILNIMILYNNGDRFDCDPTFSKGRFYKNLPEPRLKFDINPQTPETKTADCRNLPLESLSINSIMFDPPFVVAPSPKPGIIRDRFSCYSNVSTLWNFYSESLVEFIRILTHNGIIVMKCMDIVSGEVNFMFHAFIISKAQQLGLYVNDLFVLARKNVLWSPNMAKQQHARKNHSYFLILKKHNKKVFLKANIL